VLPFGSVDETARPRWSYAVVVVCCPDPATAAEVRPAEYNAVTSEADSTREYACTLPISPSNQSVRLPAHSSWPMASGPLAANGVVSVAVVPDCTPFTYNVIVPADASKVPTRCVHVPACAADADSAASQFAELVSALARPQAQLPVELSYSSSNPSIDVECCDTTP
jgi:hypothetical protein